MQLKKLFYIKKMFYKGTIRNIFLGSVLEVEDVFSVLFSANSIKKKRKVGKRKEESQNIINKSLINILIDIDVTTNLG